MKHLINIGVPILVGLTTLASLIKDQPWDWPLLILLAILIVNTVHLILQPLTDAFNRWFSTVAYSTGLVITIWMIGMIYPPGTYGVFAMVLSAFMIARLYMMPWAGISPKRAILAAVFGLLIWVGTPIWAATAVFGYIFAVSE